MKRVALLPLLFFAFSTTVNAQDKKEQDKEAIKKMCGCYEVSFDFAETFEYSDDATYLPSKVKHDKGLEWVELVEDKDNKIVMQHLLIVGRPDKQTVIKHWRQDWLYENTDLYTYGVNNKWNYNQLSKEEVKGQWTQKVFQVDDSPRYEGSATWVHVDGKSYWENTTDAPLPRREYTKRNDYNVTMRTNKHEITKDGWIHDQDNDKIIREEGKEDVILAQEKGLNTYKKVPENRCKAAQGYWSKNKENWKIVRVKWDDVFAKKIDLKLERKVDDKPLYKHLFSDDFKFSTNNVSELIEQYVIK
ncbi:MAG: hypothetical protein EVB11_05365 [Winogradskyella sp.]|nr:MAG: hypothetical protein EVB11_05365 [Winogradskyella sp.]